MKTKQHTAYHDGTTFTWKNGRQMSPHKVQGYYFDKKSGLYYLNSRYYASAVGRFINADRYVSSHNGELTNTNMFAYCGNNLVNRGVPSSEFWIAAIVALAYTYSEYTDYHWWRKDEDGTWSHKLGSTPIIY